MPTLALLDGHSLAYRAFYALPSDLATSSGLVTNAVFGFTSMLIKLIQDEGPDAIAVAWDVRGPTFRTDAYDEYKAQREKAPDLFTSQLPLIDEVLDAMGIEQVRVSGYEADDVIADALGPIGGRGPARMARAGELVGVRTRRAGPDFLVEGEPRATETRPANAPDRSALSKVA